MERYIVRSEKFNAICTHQINTQEPRVSDEEVLNTIKHEYHEHHMKDFHNEVA